MPWHVRKKGNKWQVIGGRKGKKVFGTHSTKVKAEAQKRAIYANYKGESIILDIAALIEEDYLE